MGHPQPPKPVATDNTAENSIMNGMEKRKISRATEMIFIGYVSEYEKIIPTYSGKKKRKTW